MAMRVVVVGMNPSKDDEIYTSLKKNSTHYTLQYWMSVLAVRHYSFVNAVHGAGVCKLCDVDLNFLYEATCGYDKVIALGGFASRALRTIGVDHYRLPHPSPRNRVLNDKMAVLLELAACGEYLDS